MSSRVDASSVLWLGARKAHVTQPGVAWVTNQPGPDVARAEAGGPAAAEGVHRVGSASVMQGDCCSG